MESAAAEKYAAFGFSDGEVADVLADFSVAAAEQRSVAGERVHQVEDIDRIGQSSLPYRRAADTRTRGRSGIADDGQRAKHRHDVCL